MSFTKSNPAAPEGFFEAEAAGLAWLAEAEADGGASVVGVERVGAGFIELQQLADARPDDLVARLFGASLAITHAAGAPAFGAPPTGWTGPTFIGRRRMTCEPKTSWGEFYAEQRVRPYLQAAVAAGTIEPWDADAVDELCDAISGGAFDDDEPPARVHGDLWSGNVLWTPGGVVVIDPAAHGAHRESDLAMLSLFGVPFFEDIVEGYESEHPLRDGWRDRIPLHQLFPLAVHAAGHGPSYGRRLVEVAAEAARLV